MGGFIASPRKNDEEVNFSTLFHQRTYAATATVLGSTGRAVFFDVASNASGVTPNITNMKEGGKLATDETFTISAAGIYIQATTAADLDAALVNLIAEISVADKVRVRMPLFALQGGGGRPGANINGLADSRLLFLFPPQLPIPVANGERLAVYLRGTEVTVSASSTLVIEPVLYGPHSTRVV